jgi:hypothetical protein
MRYLFIFYLLVLCTTVWADVPKDKKHEIEYLLNLVKTSNCVMHRNGSDHNSSKAVAHIEIKYRHFKNRIKTSEDFIELSATKSMLSGKYYTVTCSGSKSIRLHDWLLQALHSYRLNY